ncbi:UDP-glucuronosyltransferase [Paramyrothecium foliicola]|nr:UDP-glucuronosyltransferase [Paramyrothecium foliicola]
MSDIHPRRRILLLVTGGGFTHAAPVLELGAVLAARGHEVQFATNRGQARWADNYPFITTIHDVGPPVPEGAALAHYERMRLWRPEDGMGPMMESKRLFDAAWPDTYDSLVALCGDSNSRPDFIVADFFAEAAARDVLHQFQIQIALVCPQMPYLMAAASYIPGQPGFQVDVTLTSEHASIWSRFRNELVVVKSLPALLSWTWWTRQMRSSAGVSYSLPPLTKPNYLVLVNSFFGLETPKDLPPLIAPVGPILSDEFAPLDPSLSDFMETHKCVIYVSFGTHVYLPPDDLDKILHAMTQCLHLGPLDGIIWSLADKPRANLEILRSQYSSNPLCTSELSVLDGRHPDFHITNFAPQRAVLDHPHTKLFLTHGGGSSANETTFHGVPVVAIGYFFDQLCNAVRLRDAGVGLCLDKSTFTAQALRDAIVRIVSDDTGYFARNVSRMQRIAHVASRRKQLAADLVEEVMYDQELRLGDKSSMKHGSATELRPMHLQTADARMPFWKAKNLDMWFVGVTTGMICSIASWWVVRQTVGYLPHVLGRLQQSMIGLTGYLIHQTHTRQ